MPNRPHEENNLLKLLQELSHADTSTLNVSEIENTHGDSRILSLLKNIVEELGESSLPPECTRLMERLSFTTRPMIRREISSGWGDFLEKHGVHLDLLETWAIARWYQEVGQFHHAAAVYERLDAEIRENDRGLGHDYLIEMMEVNSELGEYDRVRDLFADVRRIFGSGETRCDDSLRQATQILAEAVIQSEGKVATRDQIEALELVNVQFADTVNELANAKFELERLRSGVHLQEARMKAEEWIEVQASGLKQKLCSQAWCAIVDAFVLLRTPALKSGFYWCIPVACQKAVESEFNGKVWNQVRNKLGSEQLGRYKYDLSINMLDDLLEARVGRHPIEDALRRTLKLEIELLISDAASPTTLEKLRSLREHSTAARHGGLGRKTYSINKLIAFAQVIELEKENGWIFQWLQKIGSKK